MAGKFTFQFDATAFRRKCDKLGRDWRIDGKFLLADQMRLWAIDCLTHTYPFYGTKSGKAQQKKAQEMVKNDIGKVIHGVKKQDFLKFLSSVFGSKGKALRGKLRGVNGVEFNLNGNQAQLRDFHGSQRGPNGHVRQRSRKEVARFGNAPGIAIYGGMYAPSAAVDKLVKRKMSHVGILAGGWIKAVDYFAVLSKKAATTRDVPAWVRKADSLAPAHWGHGESSYSEATGKGDMMMLHTVPWNDKLDAIVKRLSRTRQVDLDQNVIKRWKVYARRFNQDTGGGAAVAAA